VKDVSVYDRFCEWRPCLRVGERRGVFVQGQGYRSREGTSQLVCLTRDCRGCPTPLPPPDPEIARCCPCPDLPKPKKGSRPFRQRCRTCDKWLEGWALEVVPTLPKRSFTRCRHADTKRIEWRTEPTYLCLKCREWFDHVPKPFEKGSEHPKPTENP
jgi:hypothetical protein